MPSVVRFIKRHRKKLLALSLLFGGGYLSVRYAIRRLKESIGIDPSSSLFAPTLLKNDAYALCMRRHQHYATIRDTSDKAGK